MIPGNFVPTIQAVRQGYQQGDFSPRELIAELVVRAEQFADHNIWISRSTLDELEPYLARLESESVEQLPLFGVPFAIKDNIDVQGLATTAACPEFSYQPDRHSFVVQQLIDAGAIPLGKTNMDQFATGLVGTRSPEPWGPVATPSMRA